MGNNTYTLWETRYTVENIYILWGKMFIYCGCREDTLWVPDKIYTVGAVHICCGSLDRYTVGVVYIYCVCLTEIYTVGVDDIYCGYR